MTKFRNLLTVGTLVLLFVFSLGSCKKDATTDLAPQKTTQATNTNKNNHETTSRSMEGEMDEIDSLCFELVYPITVELPGGELQTANGNDELELIFENYYTANPNSMEEPTIQFPIDVIDEDGAQLTLNNEDELYLMFEMCFDEDWEECFTINYPVTIIYPGGETQTVNSDNELETAIDEWYEANPTSDEDPTLEFPIEVTGDDGETISVANEDELDELFEGCFGDDWDDDDDFGFCFDLVFPITINLPGGTSQVANDYEEMDSIFFAWFENNPNATDFPTLAYPIQVELEDGEIVEVNSEDELGALFETCFDDGDDWGECFVFNYPLTIVFPDETTAEVHSDDELGQVVEAWYEANPTSMEDPTLQFPVDVTTAEGEVLTINNEEELDALFEDCFGCLIVNGGELATGSGQSAVAAQVIKQHSKVQSAKQERVAKGFLKK